jgi:hypothetical protein
VCVYVCVCVYIYIYIYIRAIRRYKTDGLSQLHFMSGSLLAMCFDLCAANDYIMCSCDWPSVPPLAFYVLQADVIHTDNVHIKQNCGSYSSPLLHWKSNTVFCVFC